MRPDAFLESDRLFYRRLTVDDLPWLIEMRTPEAVARYIGGAKWQNPESLAERINFYIECYDKCGFGVAAMGLKETGELIGTSGLQPLEDTGEIELAYNMSERFWGNGYGTEAALAWLRYGFENCGLERIVACAHPDNIGSWRIMERCGMRYESTDVHYGIQTVFYGVSKQDFMRLQK